MWILVIEIPLRVSKIPHRGIGIPLPVNEIPLWVSGISLTHYPMCAVHGQ